MTQVMQPEALAPGRPRDLAELLVGNAELLDL
jgi:hypothetical protein